MSTMVDMAVSTSTELPTPPKLRKTKSNTGKTLTQPSSAPSKRFNHVFAIHKESKASPLSQDATETPSFFGFKNLMVLMLLFSNMRLMVENYRKYGFLVGVSSQSFSRQDVIYGSILYLSVPCHLFVAYIIELAAAQQAKSELAKLRKLHNGKAKEAQEESRRSFQLAWYFISAAHTINATLNLIISSTIVYTKIYHPGIGALVELHALIVWLKVCSYALTNRDLRHALLWPESNETLPELYATCPYPRNITLSNLSYFWWAPTLVYQPVYPRTDRIRRTFVIKRILECIGLSTIILILTVQYASPLLHNSWEKVKQGDVIAIAERVMKLSTISLFLWLCGFYALFHSFLNALAEVMQFADREFYSDWWNVDSVRTYWTSWNKPVYYFMRRHLYAPMVGRKVDPKVAQLVVFVFSGILHELLIGIPTHNLDGLAGGAMLLQIPLIWITDPFRNSKSYHKRVLGNSIFWISFCLVGQPFAAIWYFYRWQSRYGIVQK